MGAEPPSPSASSTLLPFLNTRSRRGSLASIASASAIDKDVLAQALDDIHNEASRCETLTSFHDYDGGGGRGGAKELVSNGVSGLYNKLRKSVAGIPARESMPRASGNASKESVKVAESVRSASPVAQKTNGKSSMRKHVDGTPSSSRASSPAVAEPATSKSSRDVLQNMANSHSADRGHMPQYNSLEPSTSKSMIDEQGSFEPRAVGRAIAQDALSIDDIKNARNALRNNDDSASATDALNKVLSHLDEPIGHERKQSRSLHSVDVIDHALESDSGDDGKDEHIRPQTTAQSVRESAVEDGGPNVTGRSSSPLSNKRPPMVTVGASHLPGYGVSQASSTTDFSEGNNLKGSQLMNRPILEPSPNFNSALQRRRTGLKALPAASQGMSVSSHLKRRVISKEFWMKDENAKGCHSCGQSFSTFRRKHHCRTCGNIFDAGCTSLVAGEPFGQPGTLRLCKSCEEWIFGGNEDDDSSVLSDDGDDQIRSPYDPDFSDEDAGDNAVIAKNSFPFGSTDADIATPSIGIPASRRNREAKRRSAVIEFEAHPSLVRPSSSHSLASLARRPRSSSHRRRHSRHQPGRGLRSSIDERAPFYQDGPQDPQHNGSLPAFHDDNVIDPDLAAFLSDDGSDFDEHPNIVSAIVDGTASSPGDREKLGLGGLFASALRKGRSRFGDKSNAPSSVRGWKDDDAHAYKHAAKAHRNRNHSFSSFAQARPSPRRSRSNLLLTADELGISNPNSRAAPGSNTTTPPNVVPSSALCGRNTPRIELSHAGYDHVRKLLSQLLRDAKITPVHAWKKALLPIVLKCTDQVEPAVQLGDDMDIRHYIKLKKVPGGRPGDTSYVSGVVFSKNVALKSMLRSVARPRIAIVTFAIEYARHETHFMSLDPVIAQEQEYLENLVNRIAALGPQILLVQRNVSGAALDLLEKAGITVVYNIKESVLAAVARVTQTTMIRSVDKLSIDPSHLGRCDTFEVKTFLFDGSRKTYIYLSGCKPDLGCTIVLRGADTRTLRSIKRITEFMCYVAYSLKLETYLMRDEFISIPSTSEKHLEVQDETQRHDQRHDDGSKTPYKYERIEEESRSRILSTSPFVAFMRPHILTQLRDLERRLATLKMLRDQYADDVTNEKTDEQIGREGFELVQPEMVNAPNLKDQSKAVREYLHAVHEVQLEKATHTFETQERQWDSFVSGENNPFDPFSHQKIDVLFSIVSEITSAPCTTPEVLGLGFYAGYHRVEPNHDEDLPLGQYIEHTCLGAHAVCEACDRKMSDHYRQYVHGYGQLSVSIQRQPAKMRGYHQAILMWSTCRICRHETTVTQMSDHSWKYSFAKYLELSFWSRPLHPRAAGSCKHDIHRDFLRCFGFEGFVVRFQYDRIETYDIVVPRARVTWKVEADLTVKNEQYLLFVQRLQSFTDSIKMRLSSINVDTLDEKKANEAHEKLEELRSRAESDHAELLAKLQRKYADSRYYEIIPLNRALRFMDEKAISWDEEFNNFERDYFPSETDIRKLATVQLRNMFLESQPPPSSVASDSDAEEGAEMANVGRDATPRRPQQDEIPLDKAQDVLHSAIEEHRALVDESRKPDEVEKAAIEDVSGHDVARKPSPRKELEEAVQRVEVKHLDLALPSRTNEDDIADTTVVEEGISRPTLRELQEAQEPFAIQPKPLGSGLLERIEQIRSIGSSAGFEPESMESKIPRLVDLKRREASPAPLSPPPPLLRAQSQPSHVPLRSADSTSDQSGGSFTTMKPNMEVPTVERRLGDRLGVGRLASKVGKVAPSLIPRSIPTKHREHLVSTVSALAKHFEQMSREFEKERLKERRQRALRSRQARANPLASSRPVVEVYENATDAVAEQTLPENELTDDGVARRDMDDLVSKSQPEDNSVVMDDPTQSITGNEDASLQAEVEASINEGDGEGVDDDDDETQTRSRKASDPASEHTLSSVASPVAGPDLVDLNADLSIPEHRKNVWFKYLADFWSKRSASGWANLEYPLHVNEHVFEDSDIIVREDEPASVIALSLACADYRNKVKSFRNQPGKQPISKSGQGLSHMASASNMESQQTDIEASLLSDTGTHLRYSFAHGSVKASCKIFYAESFDALRRRCGIADRFIESMSRCLKFDSKGGKTKSLFLRTLDSRFIIKSLQEVELKAFTKFAPDYFNFMSYTLFHGVPSVIAKMFGLFQVNIRNPATGVDFSYYLIVMENLFYERSPSRRFDLKGSMRNRKIESTGEADEVLLDENLVETIFEKPLFVGEHSKKLLQASVFNDTLFLMRQNIMDYSLMAGFDDEQKELVVGIIDCIRTYTWDKKLESWIKDRGKNKPTVTSPKDYRSRFRGSMGAYCLLAPSAWHQFTAAMAQPKTLKEREETEDTDADRA